MSRDEIVALFSRRDEQYERGDIVPLIADYAEDAIAESPTQGRLIGRDRIREVYETWFRAFSDLRIKTDALIVDDNRVAQFVTISGTHSGPFGGVAPTGRKFQITGAWLFTIGDDGRFTHDRRVYDVTNMLVQIGALKTKPAN